MSKGSGLKTLAKHLSVSEAGTVAVDDYDDDVELVQTAAYGFAVENAADHVKEAAAHRRSDCDHHAVRDLIEKFPGILAASQN